MEMAPDGKSGNSDSSHNTATHVDAAFLSLYAEIQNFLRKIMVKQNSYNVKIRPSERECNVWFLLSYFIIPEKCSLLDQASQSLPKTGQRLCF